ncbi:MAG: hypothetical protein ACYCS9_01065 [Candidatus Dormibacteria bacterium]
MFQVRTLAPQLLAAALLAVTLLAGCGAPGVGSNGGQGSTPAPPRGSTSADSASARVSPRLPGVPGPSTATELPAAQGGKGSAVAPPAASGYPYPKDAGGEVARGELLVTQSGPGSAGASRLTVLATVPGWLPGQEIFLFVATRYVATLAGPGGTATVPLPPTSQGTLEVTGFQFPENNPAAPIDGYGTVAFQVGP